MMANDFGLDFERIRAAVIEDYPRAADLPGPGFAAGPCLLKDTMQLAAFNNNNFALGQASMQINEGLPLYLTARMAARYDLASMTVGILGMAFKGESDDNRSSLSYKLKRILGVRAAGVLTADPYVTVDGDLWPLDEVLARFGPHRDRCAAQGRTPISTSPNRSSTSGTSAVAASAYEASGLDRGPRLQRRGLPSRSSSVGCSRPSSSPASCWSWWTRPTTRPLPYVEKYAREDPRARSSLNTLGPGPAQAIRYGIEQALADVVVVTMADGSDDPRQIDQLVRLVERGVVVAAASRYSRGGQQVGGPFLKGSLSRLAGTVAGVVRPGGHADATNSFKAYDMDFIRTVGIDSDAGFEIGIELVAKARRARLPVAELPTIWLERDQGMSNFKLASWIPRYVRWWLFAFGPRIPVEQVREAANRGRQP